MIEARRIKNIYDYEGNRAFWDKYNEELEDIALSYGYLNLEEYMNSFNFYGEKEYYLENEKWNY